MSRMLLADLVILDMVGYDVIIGMDWLSKHYVLIDCKNKAVMFRPNMNNLCFIEMGLYLRLPSFHLSQVRWFGREYKACWLICSI